MKLEFMDSYNSILMLLLFNSIFTQKGSFFLYILTYILPESCCQILLRGKIVFMNNKKSFDFKIMIKYTLYCQKYWVTPF